MRCMITVVMAFGTFCGCDKNDHGASSRELATEGSSSRPQIAWPPRTRQHDEKAASIAPESSLTMEIPDSQRIKWSGYEKPVSGKFVPVDGSFEVTEGHLVSRLGNMEKTAAFGSWAYIYSTGEKREIIGWGPCVTSGELIVSNIFLKSVPSDLQVENAFEAEDFGDHYTLIRLDASKGHRLCIWFRPPDTGARFSEGFLKFGSSEAGGPCADGNSPDPSFLNTAGYIGTVVAFGDQELIRKQDGWYLGMDKVSK